ncbi:MAG: SUMF1/EgtB/PvdO family nonheme iron enzyme [Bacteroidota bacterium]
MAQAELTIVFLTDAWGPTHGGINSFNFEFSKALAAAFPKAVVVINVVLLATAQDIEDAASHGVRLIAIESDDKQFRAEYAAEVIRKLEQHHLKKIDWWVGHDAISGEVALKLKTIYSLKTSRVGIFHHMDYEAYLIFKNPNAVNVRRKIEDQRAIIKQADKVFAVGPYLADSAKDICGEDVICIIPGLIEEITPRPSPNVFKVIAFGRLGQQNEIIKQLELAIISFGKAIRKYGETNEIMYLPKMVIFGIEKGDDQTERLSAILEREAGRKIPLMAMPYLENRDDLMDELSSASACMMLSLHEGFGLVAWEAIGVGVPIIISKTSGLYRFLWNIGGMATGCIGAVDVLGAPEIDQASVYTHLLEYWIRKEKSKKDVYNLRDILLNLGYTWNNAARNFIQGLGVNITEQLVSENSRSPYKFLDSFSEFDSDLFFGRRMATEQLIRKIKNEKFTVVFGIGGVGKTSLIRAGVIPNLLKQGVIPLYIRLSGEDPLLSVRLGIHEWLSKSGKNLAEIKRELPLDGSLDGMLASVEDFIGREIVLFIDRFEQLFLSHDFTRQEDFEAQVQSLVNNASSNTHIVIILREDFFPELDNFKSWNNIYQNRFRLKSLSAEEAMEAIVSPASRLGITFEQGLPETILKELNEDKDTIFPPQLQIICEQLFRKLGRTDKLLKLSLYEDMGGAKQIIAEYLEDILDQFDSQSRTAAKAILRSMVDSRFSSVAISLQEAKDVVNEVMEWPEQRVEAVLQTLIEERLLKKGDSEKPYELTHEYLISRIREWIDLDALHIKEARELLKNNSFNWKQYGIAIDKKALDLINAYRDKLLIDAAQLSFMLSAAIKFDFDITYWLKRVKNEKTSIDHLQDIVLQSEGTEQAYACIVLLYLFEEIELKNAELHDKIWVVIEKNANPNIKPFMSKVAESDAPFSPLIIKRIRELVEKDTLSNMSFVPQGTFSMGMPEKEIGVFVANGAPAIFFEGKSSVKVLDLPAYLIDKFLVTNKEFKEFDNNHTYPAGLEEHPATNINWYHAREFAKWKAKELPSEEMWEKAARGTDGRIFPWGQEWDANKCNTRLSGISGTTQVDKYPAGISPYGCYDMAGNVWEWTDVWKEEGKSILVKGGSWSKMKILPWCAYQFDYDAQEGLQNVGFRCIRKINNDHLEDGDKVYSAGGVVFTREGLQLQILLCRSDSKNEWRLPKGMLEPGEGLANCATREIKEETGHLVTIGPLIDFKSWSYQYNDKWFDEIAFFFCAEANGKAAAASMDGEFDYCQWFDLSEAAELATYRAEKEIIESMPAKLLS